MKNKKISQFKDPTEINKITTIKLSQNTKNRLEKLRVYERETYESILKRILEILNLCRVNPEKARALLVKFDKRKSKNNYFNNSA